MFSPCQRSRVQTGGEVNHQSFLTVKTVSVVLVTLLFRYFYLFSPSYILTLFVIAIFRLLSCDF